ncbi:iron-containing alcohol dehydrogenase [Brachyspira pilosicoli]|uniref:iron-containing alcohol dehydrogenase n=1 Tax=Brachyspira pilosicoli TaxID=52584 RepID=UPI0030075A26
MSRFTIPRDLYYGDNAMEELKNLKGYKKAIIVTGGSSMKRGGFLDKCEKILKETGLEVKIFDGVEPDPSIETVYKGAEAMREFQPDVIVALGGGSALDAAKAMWVFYEYPEKKFDDIKTPFTMPKLRQKAIFAAIPSTSGTASEVTAFSVITDYSTNIKYPLADFEITPDIAILDYSIPMTMPETVSADTGMDALTHSIEAYVAGLRTDITDALAMKAIDMIVHNIEKAVKGDKEGRAKLHVAQCLAGMAFSNALLGIVHSLAHKTGAEFHITHGRCNAILLPYVIEYNSKVCANRFADIAKMLKLSGNTDAELTAALVNKVKELNVKLGIKQTYKDNGVTEDHFKQKCDDIAKNAVADPCTGSNPRETDVANMKKVLEAAYYGNAVNF